MEATKLSKAELTKELSDKILFFQFAETGAMGRNGTVEFITDDGKVYEFSYMLGEITLRDVIKFFPPLGGCRFGWYGQGNIIPEAWNHIYLGMGNHLLVAEQVYDKYLKKINKHPRTSTKYQLWKYEARQLIYKLNNNTEDEEMKEEIKKNDVTEIVFILDRSGSMSRYEEDVIGGFNSTIEKQRQETGTALVSVVLFDDVADVVYDRVKIDEVRPMTNKDYYARGTTALLDAIGGAIHHIGNVHKYARKEDVPGKTVFIIITDGMENASRMYGSHRVKEMIKRQTERYGWEFIFVASNIDAVETAERYGIRRERAVNYEQSSEGVAECYCKMSRALSDVRNSRSLDNENWKKKEC